MGRGMRVETRHFGLCQAVLAVFTIYALLIGCARTPSIQTMIYESPHSTVYLEWVSRESFRASHPVTFSPTLARRILLGVVVRAEPGILEGMLGKSERLSHMFSDNDVEILLPHLLAALSQVTPEEQVVFKLRDSLPSGSSYTGGILYVRGNLLFLTFTNYDGKTSQARVTTYKGNRQIPDSSGLKGIEISFTPESALRPAATPSPAFFGQPHMKTITIDYDFLASLPSIPTTSLTEGISLRSVGQENSVRKKNPTSFSTGEAQIKALEKKFRLLKRELSDVEIEIEEIKKKPMVQ